MTDAVLAKAARLVDEHRVSLLAGDRPRALVAGDHGSYLVSATPEGVRCECRRATHSRGVRCSHAFAAMVASGETRR